MKIEVEITKRDDEQQLRRLLGYYQFILRKQLSMSDKDLIFIDGMAMPRKVAESIDLYIEESKTLSHDEMAKYVKTHEFPAVIIDDSSELGMIRNYFKTIGEPQDREK